MSPTDPERSLFLLDGMALAYRAHFAMMRNPIRTSAGTNTSALFGFANLIESLKNQQTITHMAAVWDTSAPTFRHERYPNYKAGREAMPEELQAMLPAIKNWVQALGLPNLFADGWEADDIIATLAQSAAAQGARVWMVTSDKDFGQLVTEHIQVLRPGRQGGPPEAWDAATVCERWGIERPTQVIDMLALMGDSSDNIPGVPGVGEKTAAKLLASHRSLEGVLEAARRGHIKGKVGEKIAAHSEQARLSYELATIIPEAPVELDWQQLSVGAIDQAELAALCQQFELNSLGRRLLGEDFVAGRSAQLRGQQAESDQSQQPKQSEQSEQSESPQASAEPKRLEPDKVRFSSHQGLKQIEQILNQLKTKTLLSFDSETDSLNPLRAQLVGISLAWSKDEAAFLYLPERDEADYEAILELVRAFFSGYEGTLVAHNLKYDLSVLKSHSIHAPKAQCHDTLLACGVLWPQKQHGLDYLAQSLLGYQPISYSELTASPKGEPARALRDIFATEPQRLIHYACEDASLSYQIYEIVSAELAKTPALSRLYHELELPLLPVLLDMERAGIALNPSALEKVGIQMEAKIHQLSERIVEQAGEPFNLNSPKQLGIILFDKLKLVDKPKKTKTGQYVTNETTLRQLAAKHQIVADILEYREANKLLNTYIKPLPEALDPKDQRVHTSYMQLAASTGRLASSDPNLQNIPIRSEDGRLIREAFVAGGKEFQLLCCDYSQVELRVMAHLSEDPALITAFQESQDIHTATAAKVYGVEPEDVLAEMRRAAKMVNFGIIYGISAFGLAQRLGIGRAEAKTIIDNYFNQYPRVAEYMKRVVQESAERGYGETILGRRYPMRELHNRNATVRKNAERFAINMPIQGSAADLIKQAMLDVHALLQKRSAKSRLLLQVHDELVFDLHNDEHNLIEEITAAMEQALLLKVPLQVDHGIGSTWLAAHS